VNIEVNHRIEYRHYAGRDYRYVRDQGQGNCATYAFTKWVELAKAGVPAKIQECVLKTGGGHAFLVVEDRVLDNQYDYLLSLDEVGCGRSPI
jgi:predicted transglutaminase-like cysteine proteinase